MGVGPGLLGLREGGGRGQSSRLLAFLATPPPRAGLPGSSPYLMVRPHGLTRLWRWKEAQSE